MGDPFSVAGTAVGITSLGIQTFQILYRYYGEFKGYHEDIDSVLLQVEGLQKIFDALQDRKESFNVPLPALAACQEALVKLKITADKCNVPNRDQDPKARLRDVQKRLIWPFKKETVRDMQSNLSAFKDNLALALQCAGLDAVVQKLEGMQPTLDVVQRNTASMKDMLDELRQDVTKVSLSQRENNLILSRELLELRAELTRQKDLLAGPAMIIRTEYPAIAPASLAEATRVFEQVQPQFQQSLRKYNSRINQAPSSSLDPYTKSACQCRLKKRRSPRRTGWISTFSETYGHRPQCPLFPHADYSNSVVAQFTIYSFCIQAGWQSSRESGWGKIMPMLRYRAVVSSEHSPIFKLFDNALDEIDNCEEVNQDQMTEILRTTIDVLPQLFSKDARPTDVDERGDGVLHHVLLLLWILFFEYNYHDREVVLTLLDTCFYQQVPFEDENILKSLTMTWQFLVFGFGNQKSREQIWGSVLLHLLRHTRHWSVAKGTILTGRSKPALYRNISYALKFEDIRENMDEENPLLQIILRRSKTDFRHVIGTMENNRTESSLMDAEVLSALALWYDGLEILLSSTLSCLMDIDTLVADLWKYARFSDNRASLFILVQNSKLVTFGVWTDIIGLYRNWYGKVDEHISQEEYALWNELLCITAKRVFIGSNEDAISRVKNSKIGSSDQNMHEPQLLHDRNLTVAAAMAAWAAGCRDLNSKRDFADNEELKSGTALWIKSMEWRYSKDKWTVIKWLLRHGANPTWIHPKLLTTPSHLIARQLIGYSSRMYEASDSEDLRELGNLLAMGVEDNCRCFCSSDGCRAIGCVVSKHQTHHHWWSTLGRRTTRLVSRLHACSIVDNNRKALWMASAILRVITFEKLSLTHTCCYRIMDEIYKAFSRPNPDLAKEIHDLERDDINFLGDLVEEFEAKWVTYTSPFKTFLKRVWKPRMQEILQQRTIDDQDTYKMELSGVGVVLYGPDRETESGSDSELSDEDWLSDDDDDDCSQENFEVEEDIDEDYVSAVDD